ncbi:MAG: GAF domain-containing protein [Pseudomonadota bacterium]
MTEYFDKILDNSNRFHAIESDLGDRVGHKLFTLMAIDHARGEAARIYTSHPIEYPVGGRKPLGALTEWGKVVLQDQKPWIAADFSDIKGAFFDYETIEQLGCASCLNVPVIDENADGGPRVIGTINLLHEEGWYRPEHIATVARYAPFLVEPYRRWAALAN